MNRDITYCASKCDSKRCFRNKCHTRVGFYSYSYLRNTDLCPKSRSYYTKIPSRIWPLITKEFSVSFLHELQAVFGEDLLDTEGVTETAGTIGWQKAFQKACHFNDTAQLVEYIDSLEWSQYDWFSEEITQLCLYWEDVNG